MPTVPSYGGPQAASSTMPSAQINVAQMPDVAGERIKQTAAGLNAAAGAMAQEYMQREESIAHAQTTDGMIQFHTYLQQQKTDPNMGYKNKTGKDALPQTPLSETYGKGIDDQIESIAGTIQNQQAQAQFRANARMMKVDWMGALDSHVSAQVQNFAKDTISNAASPITDTMRENGYGMGVVSMGIDAYKNAVAGSAAAAGLSAEEQKRLTDKFAHDTWIDHVYANVNTLDVSGLEALQKNLRAETGGYSDKLDPSTRAQLVNHVDTEINKRTEKYRAAMRVQMEEANNTVSMVSDAYLRGDQISPQLQAKADRAVAALAADPKYAPVIDGYRNAQAVRPVVAGFGNRPVQEQADQAAQLRAKAAASTDAREQHMLAALADGAENEARRNANAAKSDPVQYFLSKNPTMQPPALDMTLMSANPVAFAAQIEGRRKYSTIVEQTTGVNPGVVYGQEADQLKQVYDTAPPAQKQNIIDGLSQLSGYNRTTQKTLQSIAEKSPELATAVSYKRLGNAQAADMLSLGASAVKSAPETALAPNMRESLKKNFTSAAGMAITGLGYDEQDKAFDAALNIYYGLVAKSGDRSKPTSVNNTLAKQAIQLALGNNTKYNGDTVLLPEGMDPAQFQAKTTEMLNAKWAETKVKAGTSADLGDQRHFVSNAKLRRNQDLTYDVVDASGKQIVVKHVDASGHITYDPMVIDFGVKP